MIVNGLICKDLNADYRQAFLRNGVMMTMKKNIIFVGLMFAFIVPVTLMPIGVNAQSACLSEAEHLDNLEHRAQDLRKNVSAFARQAYSAIKSGRKMPTTARQGICIKLNTLLNIDNEMKFIVRTSSCYKYEKVAGWVASFERNAQVNDENQKSVNEEAGCGLYR